MIRMRIRSIQLIACYGIDNSYGLQVPDTYYAANLKPERKNAWEIGLDWRFLRNRIGVDFTYYKENTKDQIMTIKVPSESGLSNQLINAGNIQNQGIELAINTTPIENEGLDLGFEFYLYQEYFENSGTA